MGEERIAKRLDRFLILEDLLEEDFMFKQWVDSGADSNHLPICLEIWKQPKKPGSPFNLYSTWLKNEEVVQLIHSNWIPYQEDNGTRAAIHFTQNLLRIKKLLKEWETNKKLQDEQHIIQIEKDLKELQKKEVGASLCMRIERNSIH